MTSRHMLVIWAALLLCPTSAASSPPGADQYLSRLRHRWTDSELPAESLTLDAMTSRPRTVTAAQAAEDVERLFYLLAHGYSGYAFFGDEARWQEARRRILADLQARPRWKVAELPALIRTRLAFMCDCHVTLGDLQFCEHQDFWFDDTLELHRSTQGYRFAYGQRNYTLIAVGGKDPGEFIFPSLNRRGEAIHRLGTLASEPPGALVVDGASDSGRVRIELALRRSDFSHYANEVFRQDRIGGIPVLRVRSFADHYTDALERWLETAEAARDEPCVIVDLRGNGGGNERWPIGWIRRLTGRYASSPFIGSELHSRTTTAGRHNGFTRWRKHSSGSEFIRAEAERHIRLLERFASGDEEPSWSEPTFPAEGVIPNATTVILITNAEVASAGEGMVMRASRAENVVVVGENTHGALTFGNVSLHRLPRSGIDVWLPINFGLFPDLVFREARGLEPDYWVPAADALNFAVAALRAGTIATARPLSPAVLREDFIPEDPDQRAKAATRRRLLIAAACALAGGLAARFLSRRPARAMGQGITWMLVGVIWLLLGRTKAGFLVDGGAGSLAGGAVLLIAGLWGRMRAARRSRAWAR